MGKKATKPEKAEDPRSEERRRLKNLAFSKGLLCRNPVSNLQSSSLAPSKTVVKHQGTDVVKKGQRKNRFLFSFSGLLAPMAGGGKIGELSDLATGNPILYLDFPQGRMKLFGTIVYPKNRYLTLQFSRKNALCEDSFDSMVIFSDAWWIGKKEENPEENQLKFPNELNEIKSEDFDFKGGAGNTNVESTGGRPPVKEKAKFIALDAESTDNMSDDSDHAIPAAKDSTQITPSRQSARVAGKTFNFAEHSPEDDSISSETNHSDGSESSDDQAIDKVVGTSKAQRKSRNSNPKPLLTHASESKGRVSTRKRQTAKEPNQSTSLKKTEDKSSNKLVLLKQTTLSTLFEKAAEKTSQHASSSRSPESKGSSRKKQHVSSKKVTKTIHKPGVRKQLKQFQVQDDAIEEISSDSEDRDASDDEWAV